jgi:hypothetical protein
VAYNADEINRAAHAMLVDDNRRKAKEKQDRQDVRDCRTCFTLALRAYVVLLLLMAIPNILFLMTDSTEKQYAPLVGAMQAWRKLDEALPHFTTGIMVWRELRVFDARRHLCVENETCVMQSGIANLTDQIVWTMMGDPGIRLLREIVAANGTGGYVTVAKLLLRYDEMDKAQHSALLTKFQASKDPDAWTHWHRLYVLNVDRPGDFDAVAFLTKTRRELVRMQKELNLNMSMHVLSYEAVRSTCERYVWYNPLDMSWLLLCNQAALDSVGHMAHASGAVARLPASVSDALVMLFAMLTYHIGTWHVAYSAGARMALNTMKCYVGDGPTWTAWLGWPSLLLAVPTAIASCLITTFSLLLLGALRDTVAAGWRLVAPKGSETRLSRRLRQLAESTGRPFFRWLAALRFEDWCDMGYEALTVTLVTLTSGTWTVLCVSLCLISVFWEALVLGMLYLHEVNPVNEYVSLCFVLAFFVAWAKDVVKTTYWTTPDTDSNIQRLSKRAHQAFQVLLVLALVVFLNAVCLVSHYLQQTLLDRRSTWNSVMNLKEVGYMEWGAYGWHIGFTVGPVVFYHLIVNAKFRFVVKTLGGVAMFALPVFCPNWFAFRPIAANTLTLTGLL